MTKACLTWYPVPDVFACDLVEFGNREEIKKVYYSFPASVRSYEGTGLVRDRMKHCNIEVHVVSVPGEGMGTRLLAYPISSEDFVSRNRA